MDLITIGEQPDGFCPPELAAKIVKVWDRKSGTNETGDWSFQNVDVEQAGTKATIKLKNLPDFPATRTGQSVVVTAHKSDKHGLIGIKTETRDYNGKTYKSIVVTPSAKWSWGTPTSNGKTSPSASSTSPGLVLVKDADAYADHVKACAELARTVISALMIGDEPAIQACFATICIDTKNRGILLPKPSTNGHEPEREEPGPASEASPFDDDPPPF